MKISPDFDSNTGFFSFDQNHFQKAIQQLQSDLEEAKGQEILKVQESMQAIHAKVDETNALITKEKGALQEAKDKLQAQVEDLTLNLQLEKRLKTNLEEAKGKEILELQNSLQAMQAKVNVTNMDRDSSQKKIDELSADVEELKTNLEEAKGQEIRELHKSLQAMEAKVDVTNALFTIDKESTQKKIDKLSTYVEDLKNLLKLERNRIQGESSEIKQQKLEETENKPKKLHGSMNRREEKFTNIESKNKVLREHGLTMAAKSKSILGLHSPSMQLQDADMDERLHKSLNDEKQEKSHDLLIKYISKHHGFSKGRPVAACIIYKCLRRWRVIELKQTNIFHRIIHTIYQVINTQANNNQVLAYWLSNTSTLLLLLKQVEGKYPLVYFKQMLTESVEKIYLMIRDNMKKEISLLINLCIPVLLCISAPRDFEAIVNKMGSFLNILKSNNVPPFLVRKIFMQNFSFINARLFNSLLLRRECRTYSNGQYVKAGLSKLEYWCYKATEKYAGSAWDELKHIRQAVRYEKPEPTLDDICHEICPILNIKQLQRISHRLSPCVMLSMRLQLDSENTDSSSFLLDDDSRIPFSVADLLKSMDEMNIEDIVPPPFIYDNEGFSSLSPLSKSCICLFGILFYYCFGWLLFHLT